MTGREELSISVRQRLKWNSGKCETNGIGAKPMIYRTKPLMLSDLIAHGQRILSEQGDMPVWVDLMWAGYDRNEAKNGPVRDAPSVLNNMRSKTREWFGNEYARVFLLSSDI